MTNTCLRSLLGAIFACAFAAGWATPVAADDYGTAVAADHPIAWWRMADGTDQLGAHTTSTVGTGIAFGQAGPISGDITGAALFDGTSNAMMTVEDAADLNFGYFGSFSVETWVKRAAGLGTAAIVNKGNTNASFWLRFQGDQLRFLLDYGTTATSVLTEESFADDAWHHVVAVAQRNTAIRLYVDGSMVQETPIDLSGGGSVSSEDHMLEIGQLSGGSPYNGLLDELALYDRVLSASEIQTRYLAGTGVSGSYSGLVAAGSPVAWWRMDNEFDSADSHSGIPGGGVTFGQTGAIAGDTSTAAAFDGTSEAVMLVGDAADLNFGTDQDFAVEAWVMRSPDVTENTTILNKGDTNGSFWLRFAADGTLAFNLDYGSTSSAVQSETAYNDGFWHYVVGTADRDGTIQLYVDGALSKEASVVNSNISSTLPLDIGQMNKGSYYSGMMDELAIFDAALTGEQILAHYQAASGSAPHAGDANSDGKVDDLDASILAANWQRAGDATWATADFNGDGNVNDLDASILAANWQYGVGVAVPEPGSLAIVLLGMVTLALAGARRRRPS